MLENSCSIYEVRPYTCAALVATTPAQWCSPSSLNRAKTYVTRTPVVFDRSFYYGSISETLLAFMPLFVYGILRDGYKLLSLVPGLEDLHKTVMEDARVKQIVEGFS